MLDEIARFIIQNGEGLYEQHQKQTIKNFLERHISYKTLLTIRDEQGILAVCRWNMVDKETAFILDLVIRNGHKYKQFIKRLLLKGLKIYPSTKYIEWERLKKYPNRERRKYLISDILKRRRRNGKHKY